MASTIQLKTGTGSAVPSSLTQGEVAINIDNGLFYFGSGSSEAVKILESFTHITASGNISASGNIITTKAFVREGAGGGIIFDDDGDEIAEASITHTGGGINLYANGSNPTSATHLFVTQSGGTGMAHGKVGIGTMTPDEQLEVVGNISASGTITANSFVGSLTGNASTATSADSAETANEATTAATVTEAAQLSITSVGTLTTLNVSGNITASNISASGYIYGRQFEQLDSVCSAVNLDTSLIYVPLGGQSLLEQAATTNANTQKLAIATGKPRKVIMRNMIGGGIKFGNTGFTCSYWSALPETGTVSLIGAKYANGISASHEAITFDFTTGINSGSWSDVTPGSKVYMSLKADIALDVNPLSSLGVASLWEWDYNS
jgi:hypothetical protein